MSGNGAMNEIVVPICEASDVPWAASQAIARHRSDGVDVVLLNVQRPLPRHIAQFFSADDLREFHRETGMKVLEPAIRLLDDAGVPHEDHVLTGHPAETIVRFAEQRHCAQVVLDAAPQGLLALFGLGSIGSQVRHLMHTEAQPAPGASSAS